jgi:hypothetical protein
MQVVILPSHGDLQNAVQLLERIRLSNAPC